MALTGRPMAPVPNLNSWKGRLATALREGRIARGLTRPQVADKVGTSVGTIQRAESGRGLPTLQMAHAIAVVCRLDGEQIESLWRKASQRGRKQHLTRARPLPQIVNTAELGLALRRVWEMNGCPSSREMERRAKARVREFGLLSRSTAWRIRERDQPVMSKEQLFAYLVACEVPEPRFHLWAGTWQRVRQAESRRNTTGDARQWALRAAEAEQRLREAGLDPEERFPGSRVPWTVRCRRRTCRKISRIRYADFITGASGCRVCAGQAA
ncbi:helix-turn-helix transcriptional regulator [Streptomyces sp. NPDC051572]|uniref:helix-turn-helix transcriptional regulator n=1 Tax=Streptomyces sp. NPDC051572 TaxID=3155802 RepID=UPI00344EAAB4